MRTRIVGLAVLAAVLAIAMFALPLAFAISRYAMLDEQSKLNRIADATAITVASDLDSSDARPQILQQQGNTEIAVYDHHGVHVAGNGPPADTLVRRALKGETTIGGEQDLVVVVPVTHETDVLGAVRAASPKSAVYRQVALALAAMATLATAAVLAVWLFARRMARRLARPLEEFSTAAHRLGDGDFSIRTQPAGIPEIDAVGQALNNTAGRLDTMLARERAFSADASHQLRTPLTGLRFRLEATQDNADQDPHLAIADALAEADRLERTIDELLALARDTREASHGPLDLPALLDEIHHGWGERLAGLGRALRVTIDPHAPTSSASTAAARQVLAVLLDNATTHGAGTVTVTVRDATDALAIDVADGGSGITAPEPDLFARRGPQHQHSAQRGSHGIGLALARRLAEAEGGRLTLTRRAPPTFTFLAPADTPDPLVARRPRTNSLLSTNLLRADR